MKTTKKLSGVLVALCALLAPPQGASAQGTIAFDGPPLLPRGAVIGVQQYSESGVWFAPIPGFAMTRNGGGVSFFPENGTAYLTAGLGDSLMFGLDDGSEFGLGSVDLAEFSTGYPEPVRVRFIGYKPDGSTVTTDFVTDGIIDGTGPLADFQTFYFGPEFSGLVRVRIPTYAWGLDNLVVTIPEPSVGSLLFLGAALGGLRFFKPGPSSRPDRPDRKGEATRVV